MYRLRYISPYFSSVRLREALILLKSLVTFPFIRNRHERVKLHSIISRHFQGSACFSFSSARGSLAFCISAFGISKGDEVILSAFTCLAVPTAVITAGVIPVYADIDPLTLNVTVDTIIAAITDKTRIIVVQHTLGSPAPIQEIVRLAHSRGILVIEDCALAIGTKINAEEVGTFGDAAIFSMELSKTLTTGWGGILIVNKPDSVKSFLEKYDEVSELPTIQAVRMAFQTIVTGICYLPNIFWVAKYIVAIGFKFGVFSPSTPENENYGKVGENFVSKLSCFQAMLAAHQWSRFGYITDSCQKHGLYIRDVLLKLGYVPLGKFTTDVFSVSPRISFLVFNPNEAIKWFYLKGIELGTWFDGPLSPLPKSDIYEYKRDLYPNAVLISDNIVNIPCHSRLENQDLEFIQKTLMQYSIEHKCDLKIQSIIKTAM